MSGDPYNVFMAPFALKRYKKFDTLLQQKIKEEADKISKNPYQSEELKGPLKGIRSHHFAHRKTQYRIAYQIIEDKKHIEIALVKSREGFYQILRQIIVG